MFKRKKDHLLRIYIYFLLRYKQEGPEKACKREKPVFVILNACKREKPVFVILISCKTNDENGDRDQG
jgi:hypothetical protein